MTTTFSSGKIKGMMPTLVEISEELTEVLGEKVDDKQCVNFRDFASRFMCEIIGQVAFGLKCKLTFGLSLHTCDDGEFISL